MEAETNRDIERMRQEAEKEMQNYRHGDMVSSPCFTEGSRIDMIFFRCKWLAQPKDPKGLSENRLREANMQTSVITRRMYQWCKLLSKDGSNVKLFLLWGLIFNAYSYQIPYWFLLATLGVALIC